MFGSVAAIDFQRGDGKGQEKPPSRRMAGACVRLIIEQRSCQRDI
jgi:hypothetical protein